MAFLQGTVHRSCFMRLVEQPLEHHRCLPTAFITMAAVVSGSMLLINQGHYPVQLRPTFQVSTLFLGMLLSYRFGWCLPNAASSSLINTQYQHSSMCRPLNTTSNHPHQRFRKWDGYIIQEGDNVSCWILIWQHQLCHGAEHSDLPPLMMKNRGKAKEPLGCII